MQNRDAQTAKRLASALVITMSGITMGSPAFAETPAVHQSTAQGSAAQEVTVAEPKSKNPKHAKRHYFNLNKVTVPKLAVSRTEEGWDLGRGWLLTTGGGLSYTHPDNADYFFKLGGLIRLDETVFMGSYRDRAGFANGSNIRLAQIMMSGGLGKDWSYAFEVAFSGTTPRRRTTFGDVWLAYSGFMENNQVYVGRVNGNWFGLENSTSGSWMPFLERSLQANAFAPNDGLGVMTDFFWDNAGLTIAAMQPDQGDDGIAGQRDRWGGVIRGTVAPVHTPGDVWHFGMSGAWRELASTINGVSAALPPNNVGAAFSTRPSARSRNTPSLLDTTTGNANLLIRANNVRLFNVEAARQYGPFIIEGEYTNAFVHRIGGNRGSLRFDGWNTQMRYMLTGEIHDYSVRDGYFGGFKPCSSFGAWEIAARYDFLNLSDKDVRGGTQHDFTVGLNWFLSQHLRISANYIRANIRPANDVPKRTLDILGLRLQVRFK
jgi:phosphate-selective porin OprO and OprP